MAEAQIADNIARVQERIAQVAARAGRTAEAITLVAVTKTVDPLQIAQAMAAGLRDFGENYIQEALAKIAHPLLVNPDLRWHFIGHLQRNKVREALGRFVLLHSVDSVALAQEIGRRAQQAGHSADILLEVKLDVAATAKFGFVPEATLEAAAQVRTISGVRLRGLMGMAPFDPEPEQARLSFRRLHALFAQLPSEEQQILSMGMSGDFEVAIEEGATLVRIGTAIFGARG
jgi:pyridoxal phosphate enzyme (YggS family)